MRRKKIQKKLISIVSIVACLVFVLLKIFSDNISLFLKPAEVYSQKDQLKNEIKIGGFVKAIKFHPSSSKYSFIVTDNNSHDISVEYKGMLPSLFKEGQMSIVSGKLKDCPKGLCFDATQVLAKHDENYRPVRE